MLRGEWNEYISDKDEALCNELFVNLTDRLINTKLSTDDKKENELVRKAKEMIYYDLEHVLKLDEISNELHLSKFQLIRLFKAHTGISPYQYFLNAKVERAKNMIQKNKDVYSVVAA
ncbi:putative AraC family transcriptional regulator [Paenibacillus agaridevorans]|uniref:Putative AraC family transcriptional regulator n=1 Tax=Paenibacillus agaridevorans TaxID=171404 RepID=A0A2R5EKL6_9BACL|nr:putative AraC family transcriptional regulator [Paenibacillus agaridevorans]